MKLIKHSTLLLESSGRTLYAHMGILGLQVQPSSDDDRLFDGFDGEIYAASQVAADLDEEPFTEAERQEVAAFMVQRWTEWGKRTP